MTRHRKPEPDDGTSSAVVGSDAGGGTRPEPVAIAAAAQAVLAALVTIGWLHLDDATIATLGTAVAGVVGIIFAWVARSKVTPVSNPRLSQSTPLVPKE